MALWEKTTLIACIAGKCVTVVLYRFCKNQYYTSISIVQSYSGKYHDCCRGIVTSAKHEYVTMPKVTKERYASSIAL